MHANNLPTSIWRDIEKLSKQFIWGETNDRRSLSLMAWEELYKLKDQRGVSL